MIEKSNQLKPLNLAILGVNTLENSNLFEAFMLMSQNLEKAYYWVDENTVESTSALKFRFTRQELIFHRNRGSMRHIPDEYILPKSDSVIVNLGGRILDIDQLKSSPVNHIFYMLKQFIDRVYKAKLPVLFAIEDIKDSFEPVEVAIKQTSQYSWEIERKSATIIGLNDDIWQPTSSTIQSLRDLLNIPDTVPILPYSYRRPISIQNILTALLTEIKKSQVGGV